jgi:hypothetical protein
MVEFGVEINRALGGLAANKMDPHAVSKQPGSIHESIPIREHTNIRFDGKVRSKVKKKRRPVSPDYASQANEDGAGKYASNQITNRQRIVS